MVQLLKHLLIKAHIRAELELAQKDALSGVTWFLVAFDASKVQWMDLKLKQSRASWKQLWIWLLWCELSPPPHPSIGSPSCWQPCCSSVHDSDDEISAGLGGSSAHSSPGLFSLLLNSSDGVQSSPPSVGETGRPSITALSHTHMWTHTVIIHMAILINVGLPV